MTLQRYLTRLIWLCVLPLLLLAAALAGWHVHDAEVGGRAQAQRLAGALASAVDQVLTARIAGLHTLAMSPLADEPDRHRELHREALGFVAGYGSHVALIDADLRPRLHTHVPYGEALPSQPHETVQRAVQAALAGRVPVVSDPHLSAVSRESAVAIVVPGLRDGQARFTMVNSLPGRQLSELLERLAPPAGWRVTLSDSRGEAIAQHGPGLPSMAAGSWNALERLSAARWSVQVQVPQALRWRQLGTFAIGLALVVLGATAVALFGGLLAGRRLGRSVRSLVEPAAAQGAPVIAEIDEARGLLEHARDRLRVREAQLRGIFDSATDPIITADRSQTIVMANPAAARVFGWPLEQLIGLPLTSLLPERFREQHLRDVQAFGEGSVRSRAMAGRSPGNAASERGPGEDRPWERSDVTGLRADGREFPVEAAISHVHVDGQRLYTVILRDVSERRRTEAALLDSKAELEASHGELQRLIAAQQSIEENERKRIARELHDELQQVLAAIKMDVGAIESEIAANPRRLRPLVARIDELASAAITSTRRIVNHLRPLLLEELGLVAALEALASQFARLTGIEVDVVTQGRALDDEALPSATAICLYRVAQESLNNVAKHAGAHQVQIHLIGLDDGGMRLRVDDDGRGIAAQDRHKPGSFGLRGMHERVRALGGQLRIRTRDDGPGTVVEVEMPAPGADEGR